ncbi:WAT1-related protein [Apostasia shenzhenica]|uniref:WAT1-related protein n=1 Tax=Apostasia shenzhenica TaxID=1088818 RepID=A0A2H9ZXZ5_9ASPA|nr:WAT1-related protein [Apostasia shenzhenica]
MMQEGILKTEVGWLPAITMIAVQVGYAGLNIVSKLALDSGMSPYVMIAYRQLVATITLTPLAFFLERKNHVKITGRILLQILITSTFGGTLNQLLYFIGLKHTTPTIACALTNILPAITFIMAVPFRIETAEVRTPAGKAKIAGTALCVGGSMLMTFYKGSLIRIPPSSIHWRYAEVAGSAEGAPTSTGAGGEAVGAMLVVGSCAAWAAWFVMQAKMSKSFSMPYTSSALMCAMSGGECMVVGVAVERDPARWALGLDIRLASVLYIGVVGSAFAVCAMSWAIEKRGPLYVSMFSPLLLVVVAVLGWAFLDEQLYVGSAIGSLIIVVGLYMVLWGNGREFNMNSANNVNEKDVDQKGGAKTDREVDDDNGDQNHELIKVKFEEVL